MPGAWRVRFGLLRLEGPAGRAANAATDLAGRRDSRIHKISGGTYGEERVTAELRYGRGVTAGHNSVGQIMRELGIKGTPRRRLPRGAKLATVTSTDLVRREFRRTRPNELWVTDITEHPTSEGKI